MNFQKKSDYDSKTAHEKTLFRLTSIISRLSDGERLKVSELAAEFGVSQRTIQKDINERLSSFPIVGGYKEEGYVYYFAKGATLNRSTINSEEMAHLLFALSRLDGVGSRFDEMKSRIIKKLVMESKPTAYSIKEECFESIDKYENELKLIEMAITKEHPLQISYKQQTKHIEPFKIIAFDGIWYLFAKDRSDECIKTFMLHHTKTPQIIYSERIKEFGSMQKALKNAHSEWFLDGSSFDVVVVVRSKIAEYFKLKNMLSTQKRPLIFLCQPHKAHFFG